MFIMVARRAILKECGFEAGNKTRLPRPMIQLIITTLSLASRAWNPGSRFGPCSWYCDLFRWNVKHLTVFCRFHHKSLFAHFNSPQNQHSFLSWKLIYVLSDCSKLRWLRAGAELVAVALRGVRGAVPDHALCQHLPLLRHDLLLL